MTLKIAVVPKKTYLNNSIIIFLSCIFCYKLKCDLLKNNTDLRNRLFVKVGGIARLLFQLKKLIFVTISSKQPFKCGKIPLKDGMRVLVQTLLLYFFNYYYYYYTFFNA